jgi:hypothetical protein
MTPEFLEEVSSPALEFFSRIITSWPLLEISLATARPTTPAPITTVLAFKI